MHEKSQMEIEYEKYLSSSNKQIEIEGVVFYKIIRKDRISPGNGTVLICVPWELFKGEKISKVRDENGRVFSLGGPVFFSFRCPIPDWYTETATVPVEGISDIEEIGDYLTTCEKEN